MSPITHGLLSWLLGNTARIDRRGRIAVTIAGVIPDVDGFGAPIDLLTRNSAEPTALFHKYHHVIAHNLPVCLLIAGVAWACCRRSWTVAGLAFVASVLHTVCDLAGSRGPDVDGKPGEPWAIQFFLPFSDHTWKWDWQWQLASWQNLVITVAALIACVVIALRAGRSPVEVLSARADASVIEVLRRRFGRRAAVATPPTPPTGPAGPA